MKERIMIIGAGHQGLAMAAHFSINGERVSLWNRSEENIRDIIKNKSVLCSGIINSTAVISEASTDMSSVISKTIFVTVPSTAYRNVAEKLSDILLPDTIIFLNPGRTFGAVEFMNELKKNGCKYEPTLVETQSIVYTCRRTEKNSVHIYALKDNVKMACIGKNPSKEYVFSKIPECIKNHFVFAESFLETSIGNIGMILHCAPVLMNIGWIESETHSFKYYYDGMSKTVCTLVEKLDSERLAVAAALGVSTLSLTDWFKECYGIKGNDIFECIQNNEYYREIDAPQTLSHRYLDEDIPNGLVPIEALGKELGVCVKHIGLVIDLATAVKQTDYRELGRHYSVAELKAYL